MTRVGFVLAGMGTGWLGGVSYFSNLFRALRELPEAGITPVALTSTAPGDELPESLQPVEVLRTPLVDPHSRWWQLRRASQLYLDRDVLFERFLRRHGIGVLSHSGYLGRRCPIPTLPWIPDFQELHFPEFFTPEELEGRSSGLNQLCRHATAVLVSSEAARADLLRARPDCRLRTRVLRFVASLPRHAHLPPVAELEQRYGFTGPYLHLPNQFWVHKNHEVVIEALHLLRQQKRELLVLATGNTTDHRRPDHFAHLQKRIEQLEVGAHFRILGAVPYGDLTGLMAHSVAIVNPSKFEGWSTTVEEAKSLGKQVSLSDIPVHREQAPARGCFFAPDAPEQLAQCLWDAWSGYVRVEDERSCARALAELPARRNLFARTFAAIVDELRQAGGSP